MYFNTNFFLGHQYKSYQHQRDVSDKTIKFSKYLYLSHTQTGVYL